MPTYEIKAPNGRTYRIDGPAGASDDAVRAAVLQQHPDAGGGVTAAPDDSAGRGVALGVMKPLDTLASAAMAIPGVASLDRLGQRMGLPGASEAVASNQAARAANTRTGYQALGNIAGTLPTLALPGGALAQGAAGGALLSDAKDVGGVATDASIGALSGLAGEKTLKMAGAAIAPQFSKGIQTLAKSKIPLTIGQLARDSGGFIGEAVGGIEDALTSVPFVGDIVQSARDQGTTAFNSTVLNRALESIGEKLPASLQAGRKAVKYVGDKLGAEYDALVPNLSATLDGQFKTDVAAATRDLTTLPTAMQKQFKQIVKSIFENREQSGSISGQALKDAQSRIKQEASDFSKTPGRDAQLIGRALDEIDGAFTDLIERANPKHADKLSKLNAGFATLVQAERAAGSVGAAKNNGMFTPAQFNSAMTALNSSARKRAVARGTALNQDLSDAAVQFLPSQTPDSGTTKRALTALLAGGGAGASLGVLSNPYAAVPLATIAGLYTKAGQKAVNRLAMPRGPAAIATGNALRSASPFVGRAAALGVPPLLARRD